MFTYPEPPRQTTRWNMRKIQSIEDTLKEIPFPDPHATSASDPIPAYYQLADTVFTTENDEIKVGVWNEEK